MSLQANLVKNAGMENGTNNWTAANATLATDTSEHSGSQELKITATAADGGATQELLFESDQSYLLSGWLRTTASETGSIWVDKGNGTPEELVTLSDTTSYTKLSSVFKSVGQAGNIYLRADNNTDIVWFDDISITKVNTRPSLEPSTLVEAHSPAPGYNYVETEDGYGVLLGHGDYLEYDVPFNTDSFGFRVVVVPQFDYDIGTNQIVFLAYGDGDNYFALWYDATGGLFGNNNRWAFDVMANGNRDIILCDNAQQFTAGQPVELSGYWDSTGIEDGTNLKLVMNGIEQSDTDTDTST